MKANAKQLPEQRDIADCPAVRVPSSLEEAYELGWKWHVESFANLMTFGRTIEGVTRREGLAHFLGPNGEEAVIPFVATYVFGTPRVPNQPYDGGSVFSVDEEPAAVSTLRR